MPATRSVKPKRSAKKSRPELSEADQQAFLERTSQLREQRAEIQLDLAKLFLVKKKRDVALRRLSEVVAEFSGTAAAKKAQALIKNL
jgi:TolA-binding protein